MFIRGDVFWVKWCCAAAGRMPGSWRWLLSKGRVAEAVIKRIYGQHFCVANLPEQPDDQNLPLSSLLRSGYGKRMFFVVVSWMYAPETNSMSLNEASALS